MQISDQEVKTAWDACNTARIELERIGRRLDLSDKGKQDLAAITKLQEKLDAYITDNKVDTSIAVM